MAEEPKDGLSTRLAGRIAAEGGWWPFDRFMAAALYEPGRGYYARGTRVFGSMPASGSDFVTAPEMSALFGRALARQVAQALAAGGLDEIVEFGAGTGALAAQLLGALGAQVRRYRIVDLSAALRARQRETLAAWGDRVQWCDAWPEGLRAVIVGNEVLDAMPVKLLHWDGARWLERGVGVEDARLAWADRPTSLVPPGSREGGRASPAGMPFVPGTVTEIHPQAEAFVRSLAECLELGAAFFVDYGFPEHEYYHPQRVGGTLMCHRSHRADDDPLADVGAKDITAHVNFSAVALAAQEAGLSVLGYTSQARFLYNCGLVELLEDASLPERSMAARLVNEHEMGELFKVIGLARGLDFDALGFAEGDRSHTL